MNGNRNAFLVISAHWLSFFGSRLHELALPLIVYHRTGSAQYLSLAFLAETLPWVIIGPVLSSYLEQYQSKIILMVADIVRALICVCIVMIDFSLWQFLFLMFALGSMNSIYGSFRSKIIQSIVGPKHLQRILSLTSAGVEVITILAPACGAILITTGVSPSIVMYIDASTFVISMCFLFLLIPNHENVKLAKHQTLQQLFHAYRWIRAIPKIRQTAWTEGLRSLAEGMFFPVLIVIIEKHLNFHQSYLGWMQMAMAVGGLTMSLMFVKIKSPFVQLSGKAISLMLLGALYLGLLLVTKRVELISVACLIGLSMAFRQLMAELNLVGSAPQNHAGSIISGYNSFISLAYVIGYSMSAYLSSNYILLTVLAAFSCFFGGILDGFIAVNRQKEVLVLDSLL